MGDVSGFELLLMEMHDPDKGQDVALDRGQTVMSVGSNLIIGHALQPQLDDPGFVSLTASDTVEVAPTGQVAALGVEVGKISLDGAYRDRQGAGQVFLSGDSPLFESFGQQTLDSYLTQPLSAVLIQHGQIFSTGIKGPGDINSRCLGHIADGMDVALSEYNPDLTNFERLGLLVQVEFGFLNDDLSNFGGQVKILL